MNIAVLTSGILPVPAAKGGAVENLIDFYLEYNERHRLHNITVYSVWHHSVTGHTAVKAEANNYIYYKASSWLGKIKKFYFSKSHKEGYYHYSIEYFLHEAIQDIQKKHYDVIIIENRPGFVLSLTGMEETRCILHLHNDFLNVDTLRANTIFNKYQRIIGVSNYITNKVNQIAPEKKKAVTIYNSIDTSHFVNAIPKKRELLGLSENDFIIVYSGRLNEEKGILQLIQATKKCVQIPNLRLLIIGASSYGKDKKPTPYLTRLELEAEPIKDHVVYTGYVSYAQIPSYLKMADIAVVPSMWEEPFGLTVLEAMAAGLPLITTNSGGIPEICKDVATFVDKEHIVDNLANAIMNLYNQPKKRYLMSEASIRRAKLYDKETYAKNFLEAIC